MKGKVVPVILFLFVILPLSLTAQASPGVVQMSDGFQQLETDGFVFSWKITGDEMEFSIFAPTAGWVAVGFKPDSHMKGADMAMGYVQNGKASVSDQYGNSNFSHRDDISLGGSDDLELISSGETSSGTTLHFRRKLVTGDQYDKDLVKGELTRIIFAWGPGRADNFLTRHSNRGSFSVVL